MRVDRLQVKGFRSLFDTTWQPGRLNILIGSNGSGKSNLLKLLDLLQQAAWGHLEESVVKSGGMGSLLHDGSNSPIAITLNCGAGSSSESYYYELKLGEVPGFGNPVVEKELLTRNDIAGTYFLLDRSLGKTTRVGQKPGAGEPPPISRSESSLKSIQERGEPADASLKKAYGYYREFQVQLGSFAVYQSLDTTNASPVRAPNMTSYDRQLHSDGNNLVAFLHTLTTENGSFKSEIESALRAALPNDLEEILFAPVADRMIQLRGRWKYLKKTRPAIDFSDGTIRFIHLLAILLNPDLPSLIAIDEPETGLHPRMLPVIAELAVEASKRTQIVFTTHSPEFFDAFDKEAEITATICELVEGRTTLRNVAEEDLRHWLANYSLGEMFRSGTLEGMA